MDGSAKLRRFPSGRQVPQVITHEKCLKDCEDDLEQFLDTMSLMGEKLGPVLFQFGYFNKTVFNSGKEFLARLEPFLKKLPKGYRFALEIRNKQWLTAEFFDLLREHKVAYALIDQAWMPLRVKYSRSSTQSPRTLPTSGCLATGRELKSKTKIWDKVIVDRSGN